MSHNFFFSSSALLVILLLQQYQVKLVFNHGSIISPTEVDYEWIGCDVPAVFLLGEEKRSKPLSLLGRQVTNLSIATAQYFQTMFLLFLFWRGYFLRDINLFKANAEGEEKSLLEQDHQHVI